MSRTVSEDDGGQGANINGVCDVDERGAGHTDGVGARTGQPPLCDQLVVSNKGTLGADGMTVTELAGYVKQYWPSLKARLLAGEYHPQGVRTVNIPKPNGGSRQLGIPNVIDRFIQQALLQQLTPFFEPLFSG